MGGASEAAATAPNDRAPAAQPAPPAPVAPAEPAAQADPADQADPAAAHVTCDPTAQVAALLFVRHHGRHPLHRRAHPNPL